MPLSASKKRSPAPAVAPLRPTKGITPGLRHALRTLLHFAADGAAVAASYYIAYRLRFGWDWLLAVIPLSHEIPSWDHYHRMLSSLVPLWLAIFWYASRLYTNPWMSLADRFLQIVKGCVLGTGASMVITYMYERLQYSRVTLVLVWPIAVALVSLAQGLVLWLDHWMSRHEAARPVLLVGGGLLAGEVTQRIASRHPGAGIYRLTDLPGPEELEALLRERPVSELILLNSSLPHGRVLEAAEVCESQEVAFKMVPDLLELRLGEVQMDASLGLPSYRVQHTSLTRSNFLAKRAFDVAFSGLVLACAALPWLAAALLIRLDSKGPVLYKQKRFGLKGRVFEAYKFRTMVVDAEARIESVKDLNAHGGAFFKAKNDPRVTKVGKFLRRFSLDEFPQFINVLVGDMSVVGPRPLAVTTGEKEKLEADFGPTARKRMNILPGITGLWQVSGRSDVDSAQRFALDMFYIEHWSLGLDLEIILKTIPAMVLGKGAY
ncbi:MAG: sugar transferase [Elusimicrobiota bacterium]|jgi:exopolysaccharide biosynthesis polyprenyl glycosylphosphotransferase